MAIIHKTYCPNCHGEAQRKDGMIEEHIVIRCKKCRLFWLDGDHIACADVAGLQARAEAIQRYNEMIMSDINDPRWTRLS